MTVDSLSMTVADSNFTQNAAQQSYAGAIDLSWRTSVDSAQDLSLQVECLPLSHSLPPSLPPSLHPSLPHSLTHSLAHSLTHSLTHPPTHPLMPSLAC